MKNQTINKYILYADDDKDDQDFLRETLRNVDSELELKVADNGLGLIQYLSSLHTGEYYPCFIILDINMPVWDGIKTLQALKNDPEWKTIPVIMFTTSNTQKDANLSIKLGAEQFISKPASGENLKMISETFASYCHKQPERKKQKAA